MGRADTGNKFCIYRTNHQFMYLSMMEIENSTKKVRSEKMAKKEYMPLLENITPEAWSSQEKFRVESQRGLIHRTRWLLLSRSMWLPL